jgi:hypothetical protein
MSIVSTSDFVGKYAISIQFNNATDLNTYISENETVILSKLLGAELAQDYIEDDDTPEFEKIKEPLIFNSKHCGRLYTSLGIKKMLINMIYAIYYQSDNTLATTNGKLKVANEGGVNQPSHFFIHEAYNNGVRSFRAIQKWIEENKDDYPKYKGTSKLFSSWV